MSGVLGGVVAVGTDICDVARVQNMILRYGDAFLERTFTENEIAYCNKFKNSAERFAARFAAKEAMAKALQCGFADGVSPKSLSVQNSESGAPYAVLDDCAKNKMAAIGGKKMHISLSHLKDYAVAFAVVSA